ncbi:MAG TPA: hypothetical protein VKA68_16965 [bacterium]|nr:hypothetical protein [bacterium]
MLFGKNRPKKFSIRNKRVHSRQEKQSKDSSGEEQQDERTDRDRREEEIRRRMQFQSHRLNRKTGERSMLWLIMMLVLVVALFWYLSGM